MNSLFWTNSITGRALAAAALGRAFLRYYNPRRRQVGRELDAFYENVWKEAARQLDASCRELGQGILQIQRGEAQTRVRDNSSPIDDPVTLAVLSDKRLSYELLAAAGIPVPAHEAFGPKRLGIAADFLKRAESACVVKPASGTGGGRGVSTGIRTPRHLALAAAHAGVYGDDLLIERQIAGDNYRLLYLDGELLDAFIRRPPQVVGDGRSPIKTLLRRANEARLREGMAQSQVLLTIDLDMRRTLAAQGFSFASVPADGQRVAIKTVVNENRGVDNVNVTDQLHPSIVRAGQRAMEALGARFAGVDVITPDAAQPLEATGGVILEVNAPPNFYYHYHQQNRTFPVALHLLRRLLNNSDRAAAAALLQQEMATV